MQPVSVAIRPDDNDRYDAARTDPAPALEERPKIVVIWGEEMRRPNIGISTACLTGYRLPDIARYSGAVG